MGLLDRILRRLRGAPEPARPDAPGLFTARSLGLTTGNAAPPATSAPAEAVAPPEDLWDRRDPTPAPEVVGAVDPDVTEPVVMEPGVLEPEDVAPIDPVAELAAIEELTPPAAEPETPVAPAWDDAAWTEADATTQPPEQTPEDAPVEDAVAPEGSTADEPLFGAYATAPEPPASEEPAPDPVPPLFDPPQVATEPAPRDVAPEATHAEPVAGDEPTGEERTMRVHDERLDKRPGPIRMTPSEAIRLAQDGPRARRRPDHPGA